MGAATMCYHTNVLTIAFVLAGLWIGSASAIAANYQIHMGKGKLEASLTLDNAKTLSLSMARCAKGLNETTVNLGLIVDEKATVSPELAKLRHVQKDAKRNMDLCINSHCKGYTWEYTNDLGFPSWWTSLTLERNRERMDSVRIVIPNDSANYEFRGDVDGILRRICK
jgi:hypothetical protein